ncbi:hypothetical protein [Anaeromyxobacter sp. PSR-1]|uniref:hypothetical protein n=1 Tax=unclassified Anaeromyxobacter TaxID=2620896 RepID=UPI0005E06FD0|nr:hypothetical protein [Anaeromyxobacter sp. PSR-1]GAO01405.1 hypothetical protein PSR1_00259 [Anaeromyxobacter sp. PSR-1]
MRPRPLLAVLALVAATPVRAEPPTPEVALTFAWPAALDARFELHRVRRQPGQPERSVEGRFTGRFEGRAAGKELRLGYRDMEGAEAAGLDGATRALLRSLERITAVIDGDGGLVRLEGMDRAVELMGGMVADLPESTRGELMRIAPAAMQKDFSETWSMLVAFWSGGSLEPGATYELKADAPVAVLPGERIRMETRYSLRRVLDCPGAKGRRCVELWFRSAPEPKDVERISRAMFEKLKVGGATAGMGPPSVIAEAVLITEPDRLVPHRLEVTRSTKVATPDGTVHERVDSSTWTYRY